MNGCWINLKKSSNSSHDMWSIVKQSHYIDLISKVSIATTHFFKGVHSIGFSGTESGIVKQSSSVDGE